LVFPTSKTLRPPSWINCCPIMKLTSLKGYLLPIHKSWEKLLILHVHDIQSIFPDKTVMTDFNQTRITSETEEKQRQNYPKLSEQIWENGSSNMTSACR
jgi:hypothetical protein